MIKYRLNFTVPAETLFALMAKVLPIEDLSVEEIVVHAPPAKKVAQPPQSQPQLVKPKIKRDRGGPNMKAGANAIIMELFSDGKGHRATELKALFAARGLSANGVGSALEKLKKRGFVSQPELGLWQRTASPQRQSA
jgi:hypothetical protein